MQNTQVSAPATTKGMYRAGWTVSGLAILFLPMDGVMKLAKPAQVIESFVQLGYPDRLAVPLGLLELACVALYVIPSTAVLGAILLTGYLGGAVSTHVRVGDPLFTHVLFPTYVGALIWGGLFLRDQWIRQLIPIRK